MQTTWRSLILALAASFALAAITLFVIFRFILPPRQQTRTDPEPIFLIGEWEGQVAVFEGGQKFPMQVYDVYISTLPEEAQKQVRQGIAADDEAELFTLLEDYTG